MGNLEVQRSGALANTARDVVVRTVAGAEPAAVVAGLADGHTTQVGADTQHDQPLRALDTVVVRLRVTEALPLGLAGLGDLVLGAVADEDGLATPLDDDLFWVAVRADARIGIDGCTYVLALRDGTESNLNLGLSQDVGGSGHVDQEVCKSEAHR